MMKHGSYHLHDRSIIPFSHTIGLRGVWRCDLVFDALILQIIFQDALVFRAVVSANGLNTLCEFRLCEIFEYLEDFENGACLLVWYKEAVYESSCVINERDKVSVSAERGNLHWSTCIRVNQRSLFRVLVVNGRKG